MSTLYSDGIFYKNNNIINPFVIEVLEGISPGIAVDFGCGIGTNIFKLSQIGWVVYGIDRETIAVETAKEKITNTNIFQADILDFDYDLIPSFDVALCNYVLQHMTKNDAKTFLSFIDSKAKKGTLFIISFFDKRDGITFDELRDYMEKFGWELKKNKIWKRLDNNHGKPHYHEGIETVWYKI